MKNILNSLDKAFENKVRLGIMSVLMVNDKIDFISLKDLLGVTDGNLASHLKNLEKKEYISFEKDFVDRKPNTTYKATLAGKNAFKAHIDAIEKLLNNK
ncbi:transcriptional regulator [Marivirga tractuosa]|uniref:winged helix-turn-helix domain-containing protein n=1 Tax=Marivirga tractuosa TaxID=1006 RepID=UPI0035D046BA